MRKRQPALRLTFLLLATFLALPFTAQAAMEWDVMKWDLGVWDSGISGVPVIDTSQDSFHFYLPENEPSLSTQKLYIYNSNGGFLDWKISVQELDSDNAVVSDYCDWLRLDPLAGTNEGETDSITLEADSTGKTSGIYTCRIAISDPSAYNSPNHVFVSLHVNRVVHVSLDGDDSSGTGSEGSPFLTIQAAIDAAAVGDVVEVGNGLFSGAGNVDLNFHGKSIILASENGPGDPATGCEEGTCLDCSDTTCLTFDNEEDRTAIFTGFRLENAATGAIVITESSPTISNTVFANNNNSDNGGAIVVNDGLPFLSDNTFISNTAVNGSAVAVHKGGAEIRNCLFSHNDASASGAVFIKEGQLTILSSFFSGNKAENGAGLAMTGGTVDVSNTIFAGNRAAANGGAALIQGGSLRMVNNTLYENQAVTGTGLHVAAGADVEVFNTLFDNSATNQNISGSVVRKPTAGDTDTTSCNNKPLFSSTGSWNGTDWQESNSEALPWDRSAADSHPYRLLEDSPCIDSGIIVTDLFSDIRSSVRPVDGGRGADFDIGAYEYAAYYGGINGDAPSEPFKDLAINGSVIVTDFSYEISWQNKSPFPSSDQRIFQSGKYAIRLALVDDYGRRIDLDIDPDQAIVETSQQGYSIPYTFSGSGELIGTWWLRLELTSDPNQYVLSDRQYTIVYRQTQEYVLGEEIQPPDNFPAIDTLPDGLVKPDVDNEEYIYWSINNDPTNNRLFAVKPGVTVITWYDDVEHTTPYPVIARIVKPTAPKIHIANTLPVQLLPEGTPFDMVELRYTDNGASVEANRFTASEEGWSVLLFRDNEASDESEVLEVVRTLNWNHQPVAVTKDAGISQCDPATSQSACEYRYYSLDSDAVLQQWQDKNTPLPGYYLDSRGRLLERDNSEPGCIYKNNNTLTRVRYTLLGDGTLTVDDGTLTGPRYSLSATGLLMNQDQPDILFQFDSSGISACTEICVGECVPCTESNVDRYYLHSDGTLETRNKFVAEEEAFYLSPEGLLQQLEAQDNETVCRVLDTDTSKILRTRYYFDYAGVLQQDREAGFPVQYYLNSNGLLVEKTKSDFDYYETLLPYESSWEIGKAVTSTIEAEQQCGQGYVFFEKSFYDGSGAVAAYDRDKRQGAIFPVNEDVTGKITENGAPEDDLVVVWYGKSEKTKVCWPYRPLRYNLEWPEDAETIVIASEKGSGPLHSAHFGPQSSMVIYNQPNRDLPGYNPNEEHAAFFTAQGAELPAVFSLRTDINTYEDPTDGWLGPRAADKVTTSKPYTLLKYQNPVDGTWQFKVYKVADQSPSFILTNGTVQPGSSTRYYLDSSGSLQDRPGTLPQTSYFLDFQGKLINPKDSAANCYNFSNGAIEQVNCDEAISHYLDSNGALQPLGKELADNESMKGVGYLLDQHGVLVASDLYYRGHYTGVAGQEINPFYPLNQMTFGPCPESETATPQWVLEDKDHKFFSKNGGYDGKESTDVVLHYFYRLQPGFFYDRDGNGIADEVVNTCIPWQEGADGSYESMTPNNAGSPATTTFAVRWPDVVPSLSVGETLLDAKMQAGESVGLPNVKDQCMVKVLFDQSVVESDKADKFADHSVNLINPLKEYAASLPLANPETDLPRELKAKMSLSSGRWLFTALPYHLQVRLTYDPTAGHDEQSGHSGELKLTGYYSEGTGEPTLLLNALSERDIEIIEDVLKNDTSSFLPQFMVALKNGVGSLKNQGDAGLNYPMIDSQLPAPPDGYPQLMYADMKGLSTGDARGNGYVTLAFNNNENCTAPTTLSVIRVNNSLYRGEIKVIESDNPFEEKVTLRHNGDFAGRDIAGTGLSVDQHYFQWKYLPADFSGIPQGPGTPDENWLDYGYVKHKETAPGPEDPDPNDGDESLLYKGAVDIVVQGTGQQLLPDKWFSVRYYYDDHCRKSGDCAHTFSQWSPPQLYEGWMKRVMKKINFFDQKVKDFHAADANTLASMIALAGTPYEGDIALSDDPAYLQGLGMVDIYETLLNRGKSLVGDGGDFTDLNKALLFAANRLADIYMMLGNEAYADAADPTIGFSTVDGEYGTEATSIFTFQDQVASLLDEELTLLRGRDDKGVRPFYNRLVWNFTLGDGEVAYKENYNIVDQETDQDGDGVADGPDGEVNEKDAMVQFPQGHGDAWGYYLSALKKYYGLLKKDNFTWLPQSESILVDQTPVSVDYRDERKFVGAAAARARTGAEIVSLTYRQQYNEAPESQWQGYKDVDQTRAWGLDGWSRRVGQGAFFDWVTGNSLLPSQYKTAHWSASAGQTDFPLTAISFNSREDTGIEVQVNGLVVDEEDYSFNQTTVSFTAGLQSGDRVGIRVIPKKNIQKIDRSTVLELAEIAEKYGAVEREIDKANIGLNPLGIAKNAIPFDLDPTAVDDGETHFEQMYNRAVQAMNNAVSVFDHANQSTQMLRRQQDSLADFNRTVDDREADLNSRLIEVFGYPYPDDCGPGKTYSSDYCGTGPDLYHYMYVDPSELMGTTVVRPHTFTVSLQDYKVDAAGGLTEQNKEVTFHVDTDSRFGLIKPPEWVGRRKAPGEIQLARSEMLQTRGSFEKALKDYDNLIADIEAQTALIEAQYGVNEAEINILNTEKETQENFNDKIKGYRSRQQKFRTSGAAALNTAAALAEFFSTSAGFSIDATSAMRGGLLFVGAGLHTGFNAAADHIALNEMDQEAAKELAASQMNIELTALHASFAVTQQLMQLESLIRSEVSMRYELYNLAESMQQSAGRFLAAISKGESILSDRLRFRQQTASQVQDYRYKDMSFRIFRNDALQKYRAQFDLAAMYVYLAAKAYDYETNLLGTDSRAGQNFLADIVRQRSLGLMAGTLVRKPQTGTGLADQMKRMFQNFQVIKPQLGFNNPQAETNRFSLRQELMRIKSNADSDATWQTALETFYVENLWELPEYRQYCRPFAAENSHEPGLVIPFSTSVSAGMNYFGWPLGGGDSYYSSANFATRIRSVGVWFSNYNAVGLAQTPRVYLVPIGEDVLRAPGNSFGEIRSWQILDQKLPLPFPVDKNELTSNPGWIPTVDTLFDEFMQPRRHANFRAYHDSGIFDTGEMHYDSRLIGRSVWNTKWLLIIPGRSLLYDGDEGLDTFMHGSENYSTGERTGNGISDIKIFFQTYAYPGN